VTRKSACRGEVEAVESNLAGPYVQDNGGTGEHPKKPGTQARRIAKHKRPGFDHRAGGVCAGPVENEGADARVERCVNAGAAADGLSRF